jgi:hypothetical protein
MNAVMTVLGAIVGTVVFFGVLALGYVIMVAMWKEFF